MSTFPKDVQAAIDGHLEDIERELIGTGMERSARRSIVDDVEAQILDMLGDTAGQPPTLEQIRTVIARLDPPQAYASSDRSTGQTATGHVPGIIPRFNRLAIIGAFFMAMSLLMFFPISLALVAYNRLAWEDSIQHAHLKNADRKAANANQSAQQPPSTPSAAPSPQPRAAAPAKRPTEPFSILVILPALLMIVGLVGGPICGAIAISQIRHSRGTQIGMGLALADAIVIPLLLVDLIVFGMAAAMTRPLNESVSVPLMIGLVIAMDFYLIRAVWRWVNQPIGAAGPASGFGAAVV